MAPRQRIASPLLVCALSACASQGPPAPASSPPAQPLRVAVQLDLTTPAAGAIQSEPRAVVAGDAQVLRDFILLIDRSWSSSRASGMDVDGDGEVGRATIARRASEAGDQVLAAEVRAARAFLAALDESTARASVATFAVHTDLLAPLRSPRAADAALAAWRPSQPRLDECYAYQPNRARIRVPAGYYGVPPLPGRLKTVLCEAGTSVGQALHDAAELVIDRGAPDAARLPTFLLFSDGEAESPDPVTARRHARAAARYLASRGVAVHGIHFAPPRDTRGSDILRDVAATTGGSFLDSRNADFPAQLAVLASSAIRGVTLRNLTTGASAPAVPPDASGAFAGEIALAPGENRIALSFDLVGALGFSRELMVRFEPVSR